MTSFICQTIQPASELKFWLWRHIQGKITCPVNTAHRTNPMKLLYGTTSPYVRKVTVLAHETGLHSHIERLNTLPWEPDTQIGGTNPVGKVPALILDDNSVIYDSDVIVDYLDRQHSGARRLPEADPARTDVLRRIALANGAMEAIILVFSELTRRPAHLQWDYWIDRQQTKVHRSLDAMETDPTISDADTFDAGHIAMACCIGWIEFRGSMLGVDWRAGRSRLANWFDLINQRESMQLTVPVAH